MHWLSNTPVSYTHLDVYKRQLRDLSRKQKTAIRVKGESGKPTTNCAIYGYKKMPQPSTVLSLDAVPEDDVKASAWLESPEKQVIFENHHEPIIDTQTWAVSYTHLIR